MENLQAGFCINCGDSINWNNNLPFCKVCKSKETSITRKNKGNFNFCQGCGCFDKNITKESPLCKIRCKLFDRDSILIDDIYLQRLDWYRQLSTIHSIWNITPSSDLNIIKEYSIFDLFDILEIEGLITNNVFDNSPLSNRRIMNTLWRWEFGLHVSLPILDLNKNEFIDGRHRVLAAYHLNEKKIPIYSKTKK